MRRSIREVIENHTVIFMAVVAIAAFSAGWFAYVAVKNAAGLETISKAEIRELERRAILGKEEWIKENLMLKEEIIKYEETIKGLQKTILINRQDPKIVFKRVVLDPPSPATLYPGDVITVKFDYDITADDEEWFSIYFSLGGYRFSLSGKGQKSVQIHLAESEISHLDKTVDNNRMLDTIYFLHYGKGSVTIPMSIPVEYKIIMKK